MWPWFLFPFRVHFISIKPVLHNHLSYVTIFHCSIGSSHKISLTVLQSSECLGSYWFLFIKDQIIHIILLKESKTKWKLISFKAVTKFRNSPIFCLFWRTLVLLCTKYCSHFEIIHVYIYMYWVTQARFIWKFRFKMVPWNSSNPATDCTWNILNFGSLLSYFLKIFRGPGQILVVLGYWVPVQFNTRG